MSDWIVECVSSGRSSWGMRSDVVPLNVIKTKQDRRTEEQGLLNRELAFGVSFCLRWWCLSLWRINRLSPGSDDDDFRVSHHRQRKRHEGSTSETRLEFSYQKGRRQHCENAHRIDIFFILPFTVRTTSHSMLNHGTRQMITSTTLTIQCC